MSDILLHFPDILHAISLNFRCFHRTLCPTFSPKTSDMVCKMSDMSGCPTTFHVHCCIRDDRPTVFTDMQGS